jgi:cell division septation protein DedD
MNTNKLLTSILYALTAGLIIIAVYKICGIQEDKARVAQEDAEFQQTLRDFGYLEEDSTGSTYSGEESSYTDPAPSQQPTVSKDGIEYEPTKSTPTTKDKGTIKPAPVPTTPTSTSPTTTTPKPTGTGTGVKSTPPISSSDGRYRVIAGSFTVLDGARREMERLIKMGYHDAEIGRYNRGKYAVVIVKRTNSLTEANRLAAELKRKGIDAGVVDRNRK